MPALLLLLARELRLYDPPRELAWQLFHDLKNTPRPAWLAPFLPHPAAVLYDDPVALLLAAIATGLAAAYALLTLSGASPRVRATLIGAGATLLVGLPTIGFVALGLATGRPYGQDGGVVQLPLALDRVLAGLSPYGADYSNSVVGWQSRSSVFWAPLGGNPIVHHHWYLPGVHLTMAVPYVLCRSLVGFFDPRLVTLAAYAAAIVLVPRLVRAPEKRLTAMAIVALNPLVFWPQIFGTNDVMSAVPLLLAALLIVRGRRDAAAAMLGFACAFKQLAWPFAPFLLAHLAGIGSLADLVTRDGLSRLRRPALIAGAVFAAVVLPVAALDPRAFVADIFRYQVGSPGSEQYPLGGTPGFGFANLVIYEGWVSRLSDYFPFQRFYWLFVPIGALLLRYQTSRRSLGSAFVCGSAALLVSLYFSRIVNPNYLILAALLLPLGILMEEDAAADLAVVPLLLMLLAVEISYHEPLRTTWDAAQAAGVGVGLPAWLAPSPSGPRWRDPLSMGASGALAGLAVLYLLLGTAGASRRVRLGVVAAGAIVGVALPTLAVAHVGLATGTRRALDPWYVAALRSQEAPGPGAWAQRPGYSPTPVLEAWSTSWRREPPRPIGDTSPAPLTFALGAAAKQARDIDPRLFTLLALGVAAALASSLASPSSRPAVAAVALLSPACAMGAVVGGGEAVALVLLLAAWAVGRTPARALFLGAAGASAPQALLLAPLAAANGDPPGRWLPWVLGGFAIASLPLVLPFGDEFVRWVVAPGPLVPGIGLSNVLYYRPTDTAGLMAAWRMAAGAALVATAVAVWRSTACRAHLLAAGGALWILALFLWPGTPAHAAAAPIVLLALSGSTSRTPGK